MATRYTFTDDSNDVRLSGFLTPEPIGPSGGTITSPVFIDNSDDDTTVAFRVLAGSTNTVGVDVKVDPSASAVRIQGLDNSGTLIVSDDFSTSQTTIASGTIRTTGYVQVQAAGGGGAAQVSMSGSGLMVAIHAAPADVSINAGEAWLWFDQTDGVGNTKLMVKGKSADGTVKTATILLA